MTHTEGVGEDAKVTVKVEQESYKRPIDFLPQGGGVDVGQVLEFKRSDVLPANPKEQDMVMDLSELNNLHEAALLHTVLLHARNLESTALCCSQQVLLAAPICCDR